MNLASAPDWVRWSSPSAGSPLVPRVEALARAFRMEVFRVSSELFNFDEIWEQYAPRTSGLGYLAPSRVEAERVARCLLAEWLVHRICESALQPVSLAAAHEWFWGGSERRACVVPDLAPTLFEGLEAGELNALLPYLLDPLEAATRRDVMAGVSDADKRRRRKNQGVYYTPGDVAWTMVSSLREPGKGASFLDPACGSGVFLRAALSRSDTGDVKLYGIDVDPIAAENTSFVLTAMELRARGLSGRSVGSIWLDFRSRIITADALTLVPRPSGVREDPPEGCWSFIDVHPEVRDGFDFVVANPPYSPLAEGRPVDAIEYAHQVVGSCKSDISPMFVETMVKVLRPDGAMSVVMPLSLSVSSTRSMKAARRLLLTCSGRHSIRHFDRAPDAIFGDDVKTRNTIWSIDRHNSTDEVGVTGLRRWTSRTRTTSLSAATNVHIPRGNLLGLDAIPKIDEPWEWQLMKKVLSTGATLADWATGTYTEGICAGSKADPRSLWIGPVAYNFLSVAMDPQAAVSLGHNSESSHRVVTFASEMARDSAYALITSPFAYWWWRVFGDGFHVSLKYIQSLPVLVAPNEELASLGRTLWEHAQLAPVVSVNRSKTTVSFCYRPMGPLARQVQAACLGGLVGASEAESLRHWYERLIVVDPTDGPRRARQEKWLDA